MSTTVTMTLDELEKTPLTKEEIQILHAAAAKTAPVEYDPDCPVQTKEELAKFRPLKEAHPELYAKLHPEWYKVRKTDIHIKVDNDVLGWFKAQGKGYQTRMNEALRKYAFG